MTQACIGLLTRHLAAQHLAGEDDRLRSVLVDVIRHGLADDQSRWEFTNAIIDSPPPPEADDAHERANEDKATAPIVRSLTDYMALKPKDDAELIKDRFLCKGGGLLFVAPTGVGKSSWSMQTAISWSLGRSSFGLTPVRRLKSLIIQAENDDYDIREEIDGVLKGLNLTEEDQATANQNVNIAHVNDRTGFEFFEEVLEPTLQAYKPDLLWIDPVLAYLQGDVSDQKDVSRFLRHGLNPILKKFQCACVLVHHTKKQTTNGEDVQDEAYLGMGSSEFSNWCRASLVLRKVKGVNHIFRLSAPKRGTRLHWKKDDKTTPTIDKYVAQSLEPNVIFWNELTQAAAEDAQDTTDTDCANILKLVPGDGFLIHHDDLLRRCSEQIPLGMQKSRKLIKEMLGNEQLYASLAKQEKAPPARLIGRAEHKGLVLSQLQQESHGYYVVGEPANN